MDDERVLEKTNRINLLIDFYGSLLTDRQLNFLRLQYQEDLSLSEIAEQFHVTRQAVNDHVRRSIDLLEDYEQKLGLLRKYNVRVDICGRLSEWIENTVHDTSSAATTGERQNMLQLLNRLKTLDEE